MYRFLPGLIAVLFTSVLLLGSFFAPALAAQGGNADAATKCQAGEYLNLVDTEGNAFKNVGACVAHGAQDGELLPKPTLTVSWSDQFQTITGTGLLPGTFVTYSVSLGGPEPLTGTVPGSEVQPDGTVETTNSTEFKCGSTNFIASATTETGGTITSDPNPGDVPLC